LAGRRTIYFNALVVMFFLMLTIGSLGVPQADHPESGYSWSIGTILIVSSFLYNCSIGPLTNTLCSEIPSALLRSKSIVLARWVYSLTNIVVSVLNPYMLNPTAWNWSAKAAFFWAGWCVVAIVFAFFYVPETKNRTTAELDILFDRKISPRRFHKTPVDPIVAIETETARDHSP
jgi:MFS transporter, SP family, general alpha glucoside:H+ symporter